RPAAARRPWQVWRHRLGTAAADDELVFEEPDERFYVSIGRTRSGQFLVITSASKLTTEVWVVHADRPGDPFRVVTPRRDGVEYHVEHHWSEADGDRFFVLTNDDAENFRLMVTPAATPGREHWNALRPHREDTRLDDVDAFARHLVLSERADALEQLRVLDVASGTDHVIAMPEAVYSVGLGANFEFDSDVVRLEYTSLVRPPSCFDYHLVERRLDLVREQPVTGYDREPLETRREWATASDGTRMPISIVHRRGLPRDGSAPMLL